jgi:DNA-binding winged helix-turn-helix (wHTH) protein
VTQVRFGDFVLDTATRQLLRSGRPAHLSPKAYRLLTLLVEERPRALSKSDLQDRLWPETYVVEANLANLVGEIRAALGDDPRRPKYVRTVHGFGYAFQGSAAEAAEKEATTASNTVYRLIWKRGRATLSEGEHVLGRDAEASVMIDSPSVSRRHARILIAGSGATIEDLGSKNGTLLNERRVDARQPLADGDRLHVGSVRLTFRVLPAAASTQTAVSRERDA